MTIEQIMDIIDGATKPEIMSKAEACNFLIELQTQIDGRIDALADEMGDDE